MNDDKTKFHIVNFHSIDAPTTDSLHGYGNIVKKSRIATYSTLGVTNGQQNS